LIQANVSALYNGEIMSLPYANSTANPMQSEARIKSSLRKFGVGMIVIADDIDNSIISIMFKYNGLPVSLPVDYGKLAGRFMEDKPHTSRTRSTLDNYEFKMKKQAHSAAYSIMEDFIKSMISMVETDIFTFEEVFLPFFVGKDGKRVAEVMIPQLSTFKGAGFLLTEGA